MAKAKLLNNNGVDVDLSVLLRRELEELRNIGSEVELKAQARNFETLLKKYGGFSSLDQTNQDFVKGVLGEVGFKREVDNNGVDIVQLDSPQDAFKKLKQMDQRNAMQDIIEKHGGGDTATTATPGKKKGDGFSKFQAGIIGFIAFVAGAVAGGFGVQPSEGGLQNGIEAEMDKVGDGKGGDEDETPWGVIFIVIGIVLLGAYFAAKSSQQLRAKLRKMRMQAPGN